MTDLQRNDEAQDFVAGDGAAIGVAVEHRSRLATGVALGAAAMTVAWFARALQTGEPLAWVWCLVLGAIAVVQLFVVRDSSAPLLLADDQGVRVRHGETWSGLRWHDIDHVEVASPSSWLRDGRIAVHPREGGPDLGEDTLSPDALSVPLGATTRLRYDGLTGDLVSDLDSLASGQTPVVVVTRLEVAPALDDLDSLDDADAVDDPEETHPADEALEDAPAPVVRTEVEVVVLGSGAGPDGVVLPHQVSAEERDEVEHAASQEVDQEGELTAALAPARERKAGPATPVSGVSFDPVHPVREPRAVSRSEVVRETVRAVPPPVPAQRRRSEGPVVVAHVDDVEAPDAAQDLPHEAGQPRPAEARIGPVVAAARHRARLSIDTLSDRTRIRPHVLECIEVDDFAPCGGDFYARGHLRTLARIFGLDAAELIAAYDEHYARPVVGARQVFEAELATGIGGGMRATSTGPRWSVLAAAVVALGLVWGVAHVFTDEPQEIVSPAPNVDSAGLAHADPAGSQTTPTTTLASLGVTAVGASPQVVVRDRDGRILWAGKLAEGQHQQVIGLAPFDVTASNGEAVKVSFLGKTKGTVGPTSAADSKQFG